MRVCVSVEIQSYIQGFAVVVVRKIVFTFFVFDLAQAVHAVGDQRVVVFEMVLTYLQSLFTQLLGLMVIVQVMQQMRQAVQRM